MATTDVLVLGAGMVGVCTALQLARRGHAVCLVDRRGPGQETSHGNAGIIQREAVEPYAFPRDLPTLAQAALNRGTAIHYHARALPGLAAPLARYWHHSAPARHAVIAQALVRPGGYHAAYRTARGLDEGMAHARAVAQRFGVAHTVLDAAALARAEPGLRPAGGAGRGAAPLVGAVHWPQPWTCSDPGALVAAYARRLRALGGQWVEADAMPLAPAGGGWQLDTPDGRLQARHAVVALGPWSAALAARLGYRLPLFVKRGYHRHFAGGPGLQRPLLDAERGFVLAPMARGVRLTTGAEFARLGAEPTPVQLGRATAAARQLLDLPQPVDDTPWLGNRPCTPDMLPIVGPAPRHPGLWFHCGHAHQGFTLGPVTARLLAEMLGGGPTFIDPAPYALQRFLR